MAEPGWYEDPTAPDSRRYWDGSAWADEPPRKRPPLWGWLILAVVLIGAIVAALTFVPSMPNPFVPSPVDTRTARPSGTQWNEMEPSETPTPTPVESGFGESIDCPESGEPPYSEVTDNRISSGHLSIGYPQGWVRSPSHVDWMYDYNSVIKQIEDGWISNVGVGYIKISGGFSDHPPTAAEQFISCMASSGMFRGFTKREVLINEEYAVSGKIGWRLLSKMYVAGREHQNVQGDEVNIVVIPVDEDEDVYAVYVSCASIDREENLREVQGVFESLTYA